MRKMKFKRLGSVLLSAALFAGAVPAVCAQTPKTLDEILADAFTMNFDGELPSGVKSEGDIEYVDGVNGKAAKFDGSGTYFQLPDNFNKGIKDFTLSMWVRFDALTPDVWQRVFDLHGTGHRSMYFGMWQYNGGNNVRFGIEDDDGEEQASAFGAFKLGEWVNYTITQDSEARILYINGREVSRCGSENNADEIGETVNNYIGHSVYNGVPTADFNGALDELYFAREAMSPEQVLELAIRNMDDYQAVEAYKSLTYLNFLGNDAEKMFDFYTYDDGRRSVKWSSNRPELLTVSGVTEGASVTELTEVTLTAAVCAGEVRADLDYTFIIDPSLVVENMSMEDIEKRNLRRSSAVNFDTKKTYLIKRKDTNEYLSGKDGALSLTADKSEAEAKWRLADTTHRDAYAIVNVENGLCLDVRDFGNKPGTEVLLYRGGKAMNQNWYFISQEDGISILNYNGNHFLNEKNGYFSIESLYDAQKWEIEETQGRALKVGRIVDVEKVVVYDEMKEGVYYTIKRSGGYMSTDDNGNLCIKGNSGDNSLWYLTKADGYYTITNKASEKNLNVNRSSTDAGAGVITYTKGTAPNEQWGFMKTDSGYTITGAQNKNYLCGYSGAFRMEAEAQVWEVQEAGSALTSASGKQINALVTDYCPQITTATDYETGIIHPGISLSAEDIQRIQRHVRSGDEPWSSAFALLAAQANASKAPRIHAWDGGGDTTKLVAETRLKNLRNDATTAANQALMYVITGDEVFRENSMKIIRKWSELRDVYATLGSDRIDHGVIAYKLSFAAELMKYSSTNNSDLVWTSADNSMFVGMLEAINGKHNRYWHWMNQHGICNTGTMASAIFRNDLEQYKTAVVRTTVNPEGGGESAKSGGAIVQVFKRITKDEFLNEDLEEPVIVHVEMGRDMGHAYDNNSALSTCAMMSLKQNTLVDPVSGEYTTAENGVNIFEFANHRLLAGTNLVSMYNLGKEVAFPSVDVGGYHYASVNDTNRGNLYNAIGQVYCYYKYIAHKDMQGDDIKYVTQAYEARFPEAPAADDLGMATLLYTADEGIIEKMPEQDSSSSNTWQSEYFTAVNYGSAEAVYEEGAAYAKISLADGGTQIAHATAYYAPSENSKITLRVRTHGEVKVTLQNEHTIYAPFVEAIIPDTMGQWENIEFDRLSESVLAQRIMFLTFEGDGGEMDIDYMKISN